MSALVEYVANSGIARSQPSRLPAARNGSEKKQQ
jgi:hypothetical protein